MNNFFRLVLSLVLVSVSSANASAGMIVNGSFETFEVVNGFPTTFGDWGIDTAGIVSGENGINPFDGNQMLKFGATFLNGGTTGLSSDVGQLVDMGGAQTLRASAWFNRVPGDSQTDTEFRISIRAFTGTPATFGDGTGFIAEHSSTLISDGDVTTWQQLTTEITLPANADYILIGLSAVENIFNDSSPPEFDGHYADLVSLEVVSSVPEPSSLFLLGSGAIASLWRLRRRR